MRNQRGTSVIETLIWLPVFAAVTVLLTLTCYLGFAGLWLQWVADEWAICALSRSPTYSCQQRALNRVQLALPFGEIVSHKIAGDSRTKKIELKFYLHKWELFVVGKSSLPKDISIATQ